MRHSVSRTICAAAAGLVSLWVSSVVMVSPVMAQGGPAAAVALPLPPVFFREPWKDTGPEHGVTAENVSNANLELKVYDPAQALVPANLKNPPAGSRAGDWGGPTCVQIAGYDQSVKRDKVPQGAPTDPPNLWTGVCATPVAVTLRDRANFVDLTGLARIRWVTRVSGFHGVRPVVKLADGTWLVGDIINGQDSSNSTLFLESEFAVASVRWLALDITRVVTRGAWVEKPDLSRVDEVLPGSGHGWGGFVNVGRIEVHGRPVKR
jgi:hypothetical protein